jgi:flavin reductase (DIM6/NTAB) family NADH-FMN oxidoreductase RutF
MDDVTRYKQAIGRFTTGVTVVASGWGETLRAMTANAVTSLSLEPLQLLVCIRRGSHYAEAVVREGHFSVNVLRRDQGQLARYFSGGWSGVPPRFEFVPWAGGCRLKGCISAVQCDLGKVLDGGDHIIAVGDVRASYVGPGSEGLLYAQGRLVS